VASAEETVARQRRPILALLSGTGISIVGSLMTLVAVPWFVLVTTGSAARTGITTAVWVLPVILSGAFAGPIVDRIGHKRSGVLGDLGAGLCVALVPTLYHTVGLAFPLLLTIVFIRGLFDFPGRTGRRSLVPQLAELAKWPLERANSAFATIQNLAMLLGPALAGLLIARFSASNVMWIDGATYAFSALMTALFVPAGERLEPPAERYRSRLVAGYRFVRQDQLLLTLLGFVTLNTLLTSPLFGVELPVYARRVFGSAVALGLMATGYGAGSLISSFLYGAVGDRLSRRLILIGSVVLSGTTIGLLTFQPSISLAVLILVLNGFAAGPIGPLYQTVVQERVRADLRGRVFGLSGVTFIAMPIGVLGAGLLIQTSGLRVALTIQSVALLAAATALSLTPTLHNLAAATEKVNVDATKSASHCGLKAK
jgi:MFS family permease